MTDLNLSRSEEAEIVTAIVVGDPRVGKTTLVRRACQVLPQAKILPTLGIQFASTNLEHQSRPFQFKFWDLCKTIMNEAGQQKFAHLFDTYVQRCNVGIVVFDLSSFESFHNAKEWVMEIRSADPNMRIIVMGNKKDIFERNSNSCTAVKPEEIKSFVSHSQVQYQESCALTDNKLIECFKKLLEKHFIPNDVILEGANEAKSCGCFC